MDQVRKSLILQLINGSSGIPSLIFSCWASGFKNLRHLVVLLWSPIIFVCFCEGFPKGEYVNLTCSIILLWSGGSISSPVRFS